MKINAPLSDALRAALGAQGVEWDPILLESVQPVVLLASDVGGGSSSPSSPESSSAVDAGKAFITTVSQPAVAAEFSHVQFFNPVDSGKVFYLDRVHVLGVGAAITVVLAAYHTALATLVGNFANKRIGQLNGACEVRRATNVAGLGSGLMTLNVVTSSFATFELAEPLRLDAGLGLLVRYATVNQAMTASAEGREYDA